MPDCQRNNGQSWVFGSRTRELAAIGDEEVRDPAPRAGWTDEKICKALDTNIAMVTRVRSKLVNEGLDAVFARKKRETPPVQPIFDGERQAQLIALACSKPPPGYARWTLRLLADKVVERKIVVAAHFNTVGRALKKTTSSRTSRNIG